MIRLINLLIIILVFASFTTAKGCSDSTLTGNGEGLFASTIITGAEQTSEYLPLLRGKAVAVLTNQTGIIGTTHIVDSLLSLGINIKKVMSPEHGFRGQAAAGQHISSGVDARTGLPVVSLYGSHRKPTKADLQDIDIVVFDIQDVGVRFYTYISTLHYLMEACAENGKMLLILDRPNPNGFYVDGPVLETKYSSFVGMDPIPVVHGLTVGEYALMLNGEGWLKDGLQCNVKVIKVKNYSHSLHYKLPVAPSPNLSTMAAIYLYPSLCLFEGTVVSVGRGTSKPFEIYGHPGFTKYDTTFVPRPIAGKAPHPKLEGKTCKGFVLTEFGNSIMPVMGKLYLFWLRDAYFELGAEDDFFNPFFTKLAGTEQLRTDIERAKTVEEIRAGWQDGLNKFKKIRKKYLLYPDFE